MAKRSIFCTSRTKKVFFSGQEERLAENGHKTQEKGRKFRRVKEKALISFMWLWFYFLLEEWWQAMRSKNALEEIYIFFWSAKKITHVSISGSFLSWFNRVAGAFAQSSLERDFFYYFARSFVYFFCEYCSFVYYSCLFMCVAIKWLSSQL